MSLNDVRKPGGRPSKRPSESELAALYAMYTAAEIAAMYEVSVNTVRGWIAYYRRKEKEMV